MIVVGATWVIDVQRRRPARRPDCDARPHPPARAGAEDVDRVPAREPVPHRRHARDVHARRLHARRRARPRRGSFVQRASTTSSAFGGGFDIRADGRAGEPDRATCRAALARAPGVTPADFRVVSSQSALPVKAHQVGDRGEAGDVPRARRRRGIPHATRPTASPPRARGYGSAAAVWHALRAAPEPRRRRLARRAPRARTGTSARRPKFRLRGFYLEDKAFRRFTVDVRDPQTGRARALTVIGVLSDTRAARRWRASGRRSRRSRRVSADRVLPTVHLFALQPGVDPSRRRGALESAFLANGMQADVVQQVLARWRSARASRSTG